MIGANRALAKRGESTNRDKHPCSLYRLVGRTGLGAWKRGGHRNLSELMECSMRKRKAKVLLALDSGEDSLRGFGAAGKCEQEMCRARGIEKGSRAKFDAARGSKSNFGSCVRRRHRGLWDESAGPETRPIMIHDV